MNICILARKRLRFNTRVVRQAKALVEAGNRVTVVALELPVQELMDATPEVRYLQIELDPWPARLLRFVNRLTGLFFRMVNLFLRVITRPVNILIGVNNKVLRKASGDYDRGMSKINIYKAIPAQTVRQKIIANIRRLLLPYMDTAKTTDFSRQVKVRLGNEKFDFCQAHDNHALQAAGVLAEASGAKLVFDSLEVSTDLAGMASDGVPDWLKTRRLRQDKTVIRAADEIICIGPALADWVAETYEVKKPEVIRNCSLYTDIKDNTEIRKDLRLEDDIKLALVVGSIYRYQGIEQLIESLRMLNDRIHLVLLGPITQPGYEEVLHGLIAREGMESRVHFPPVQSADHVVEYASGADIGVIARQAITLNNKYCLPNKIFELVMARLPVAVGRLKNIESIVKEYDIGLVFDETDPADMALKIGELLEEENHSYYKSRVNKAAGELCWEKESENYVRIFNGRN